MVNFRFHIVSLVAVFLALAVGIVMGTTVISEGLLDQLRGDAKNFSERNRQLRGSVADLESEVAFLENFGKTILPGMISGVLKGRSVVLLIQTDAPASLVDRITEALKDAGAAKPARLQLTKAWSFETEADRDRLALATGTPVSDAAALLSSAGRALGQRLGSAGDVSSGADVLSKLDRAGFLTLDDIPAGPFPLAESLVVIVGSGARVSYPDPEDFFSPLLQSIEGRRGVVVAESRSVDSSIVQRVRGDRSVKQRIGTVDHADTVAGQISIVFALRAAATGTAALHLGTDDGAEAVAPTLPAPATR